MTESLPAEPRLLALAMAFEELRREIAGADKASVMDAIVGVALKRVPAARSASITVRRGEGFKTAAATDEQSRRADYLQYELGSGPCVDAILEEAVYVASDLNQDPRWPEFGRRVVREVGLVSMLSFRLAVEDEDVIGGLNLYSDRLHAFGDDDRAIGLLLATHGGLAVSAADSRQSAENLARALDSNRDIGVAIGVLMGQHKLTREQAFDLLRIASQHNHRKLHDIALEVSETGVLPLPPTKRPKAGD